MASPAFLAAGAKVAVPQGVATNVATPAGLSSGNLILFVLGIAHTASPGITAPSGFTLLQSSASGSFRGGVYVYQKIATGSEPANYPVTVASASGYSQMYAWSGTHGTTPIDVSAISADQPSTVTITAPTITTTVAETCHVNVGFEWNERSPTFTANGALVSRGQNSTGGTAWIVSDESISASGSVTGRTVTGSVTGDYISISIALAPASGAAGGTFAPRILLPRSGMGINIFGGR